MVRKSNETAPVTALPVDGEAGVQGTSKQRGARRKVWALDAHGIQTGTGPLMGRG